MHPFFRSGFLKSEPRTLSLRPAGGVREIIRSPPPQRSALYIYRVYVYIVSTTVCKLQHSVSTTIRKSSRGLYNDPKWVKMLSKSCRKVAKKVAEIFTQKPCPTYMCNTRRCGVRQRWSVFNRVWVRKSLCENYPKMSEDDYSGKYPGFEVIARRVFGRLTQSNSQYVYHTFM